MRKLDLPIESFVEAIKIWLDFLNFEHLIELIEKRLDKAPISMNPLIASPIIRPAFAPQGVVGASTLRCRPGACLGAFY